MKKLSLNISITDTNEVTNVDIVNPQQLSYNEVVSSLAKVISILSTKKEYKQPESQVFQIDLKDTNKIESYLVQHTDIHPKLAIRIDTALRYARPKSICSVEALKKLSRQDFDNLKYTRNLGFKSMKYLEKIYEKIHLTK